MDPESKVVKVLATRSAEVSHFEPGRLEHISSWFKAKTVIPLF